MKPLKEAWRKLSRISCKLRIWSGIRRLQGRSDEVARSLAKAVRGTLRHDATPEEKTWMDRIEALREELCASALEVEFVDYGAGDPSLGLTAEDMARGRVVTKTIGDVCRVASQPSFWSFLLFKLVRELRPSVCIELGTCLGISTAFQAAALRLNQRGHLVTVEGAESLASLSRGHLKRLGLDNVCVLTGLFQDTLWKVLRECGPVDYVFIDGHHDEKATLAYFEQMIPSGSDRMVLVFDDINWSAGMKRAWKAIEADERVRISVDLGQIGIGVIEKGVEGKQRLEIPLV